MFWVNSTGRGGTGMSSFCDPAFWLEDKMKEGLKKRGGEGRELKRGRGGRRRGGIK
jgi:hypothetical protein